MQKMRQEMQTKMKEFRESRMSEMMNILNEEQKGKLEEKTEILNNLTLYAFLPVLLISIILNIKDYRIK